MISTKKRRQGSTNASNSDGYASRTLPRPSDIARNLATPTDPNSSSLAALHRHQQAPSPASLPLAPSSSKHGHSPVSLSLASSYGVGKTPTRAVANPYDDLSLYASQINAVHKPEVRPGGDHNNGSGYRGRVSATSGGYFGYNKPAETSSGHYGYNKHPGSKENDGRYGYNNKPSNSKDTRGYYGFSKPSKTDSITPNYFGFKKANEAEPKGYYDYNKPAISDSVFLERYGYDKTHADSKTGKVSRSKNSADSSSTGLPQMPSSMAYSATLPWNSRYSDKRNHLVTV